MGNEPLSFEIKTPEWTMSFTLNPSEGDKAAGEERAKRLLALIEKFSSLPPEIQEKIVEFAEAIEEQVEKSDGQNP
jgi:hypothetical protein